MGKSKQVIAKSHNNPSRRSSYSTGRKGINIIQLNEINWYRCRLPQENLARCMCICENYWGPIIKQYFKVGWMASQPSLASVKLLVVQNITNNINDYYDFPNFLIQILNVTLYNLRPTLFSALFISIPILNISDVILTISLLNKPIPRTLEVLEVLEGLNALLAKAYSPPDRQRYFKLNLK